MIKNLLFLCINLYQKRYERKEAIGSFVIVNNFGEYIITRVCIASFLNSRKTFKLIHQCSVIQTHVANANFSFNFFSYRLAKIDSSTENYPNTNCHNDLKWNNIFVVVFERCAELCYAKRYMQSNSRKTYIHTTQYIKKGKYEKRSKQKRGMKRNQIK